MKVLSVLLVVLSLFFSTRAFAQEEEDCQVMLSLYTELYKQGSFVSAYPLWKSCFDKCSDVSKNIYIQGPKIVESVIAELKGDERERVIDTLFMIYDQRIQVYGEEGKHLSNKAIQMYKYRPAARVEIYNTIDRVFELNGSKTDYNVLKLYMVYAIERFNKEEITKETVVDVYSSVSDALAEQIASEEKEDKKAKIKEASAVVEELFVNCPAADCNSIIEVFAPKMEADPANIDLAKKIVNILRKGNSDECKLSDLYMRAAVLVYENEKSSSAAHAIGQAYFKRGDNSKAEQYYNEAISLEEDNSKKSDMYYELALLYYTGMNSYSKARNAARSAIAADPTCGKAYMLIGRVYAAGGKDCGESAFDKKALYYVVVDQFVKAKNADPSLAQEANELINRYSAHWPSAQDGFWVDIKEGDSYT
ncbi:MAG: tetratricopeptide repeat protein, partial [Bacteroidales bacterium]|nr:tetratricopeptide repeat protein [Bacteroidales bacterium]